MGPRGMLATHPATSWSCQFMPLSFPLNLSCYIVPCRELLQSRWWMCHRGCSGEILSNVSDLLFPKVTLKSFRSMHRCPTSLCEQLRIISHVYHTRQGSGEVSLNLHGPVLYGPAERAVCILKWITSAHSSTLHISLRQSRPSPGFITPVPQPSASGWVHGGLSSCRTVKHPSEGPMWLNLWRFQRDSQLNFVVMLCPPSGGSRSLRFQISTHESH